MFFNQKLDKYDALVLDLHLFNKNKKININIILMTIVSAFGAGYCIYKKNWIILVVFLLVAIFALFGIKRIYRNMLTKNVFKKMGDQIWDINVTIEDDKIYYVFAHEDLDKVDPFIWGDVSNCIEFKHHFIMQINAGTYLLFKKESIEDVEKFRETLKENLGLNSRFFINDKKEY